MIVSHPAPVCLDEPGTMGSLVSALTSTMQRVSGRARVMGASNNGWSSPNKSIPFHTGVTTLQRYTGMQLALSAQSPRRRTTRA